MSSIAELKKELELVTEHLRIAKENLEFLKEENEKLKKEEERKSMQTQDLWELLSMELDCQPYIVEALITLRGEEYVKEVFAEDYEDYRINVLARDEDED